MQQPIQTRDIDQALKTFASENSLEPHACDFVLHGVTTYIKDARMEGYVKYSKSYAEQYKDPTKLINDRVSFRQFYKITPIMKSQCDIELDYELHADPYYTHPHLLISPESQIPYRRYEPKETYRILMSEINKIKAIKGMLIGILNDTMVADIKTFTRQLYTRAFTQTVSVTLFDGIKPEIARPSRLLLHFEKKNQGKQLKEVEIGELIVEYIKPLFGSNGLNAMGRRISKDEVANEQFITSEIDSETIEKREDSEHIRLYSKKRGFVESDQHLIKISNKLRLHGLKRIESQITAEEKNDVEIVVDQKDITQDTIGEGVKLTSETIHISGYVADKAELKAKHLVIEGVTHQSSKLFAKDATINRHKGLLRCRDAKIKLLEGGEVHASKVHIETALGGKVYADELTIGTVRHHLKAYASQAIIIEKVKGEENLFMIETEENPIVQSRLRHMQIRLDALRDQLKDAKTHSPDDVPSIMNDINAQKAEIEEVPWSLLHAKITIKERIDGYNTISFALPDQQTISYHTVEKLKYAPFHITRTDEEITLHPVGITITLKN